MSNASELPPDAWELELSTVPVGIMPHAKIDPSLAAAWTALGRIGELELPIPAVDGFLVGAILRDSEGVVRLTGILPAPVRLVAGEPVP